MGMKIPMPLLVCAVTHHTQTVGTDVGPIYSLINPHSTIVLIYILSVSNKSVGKKSPKSVHHLKFTSSQRGSIKNDSEIKFF